MENIFEKIVEFQKSGRSFVLATVINSDLSTPRGTGAKMLVLSDGKIFGTIGGGGIEKMAAENAARMLAEGGEKIKKITYDLTAKKRTDKNVALGMLCGGQAEVMLELYSQDYGLVICGGGHIGEKLAGIADLLEMPYAVIDTRPEFANEKRFPKAAKVTCGAFEESIKELNITSKTAIVIVTYGHKYDYECLKAALSTQAYYIVMIGSKNKVGELFKRLKTEKIKLTGNVYSPVGLDIGSDTPAEIAISVFAEIFKVKNGGSGKSMRIPS